MKKLAFILLLSSCSLWAQTQISGSAVQIGGNTGTGGTGTPNYYAMWCTNNTTLCNGHFDDGVTTTGTITSSEPLADTSATAAQPAGVDTNSATSVGPIFSRIFLCPNTSVTTPGSPWNPGCVINIGSGTISTGPNTDGAQTSIQWINYGSSTLNRGSFALSTSVPRAQAIQFDLAGDIWFPNLVSFPCIGTDANGKIVSVSCATSSGLSGMTAGQVPIAATATTVTSSKALAGSGAGIATGPTTSTLGDCVKFADTAGTLADAGAACGAGGGGLSGQTTNYLPLATSATASTTSSIVSQNGTSSVTVNTTGTAYGLDLPEGTALTPTAGHEIINSNSTAHTLDLSSNGGAFSHICTAANGYCAAGGPVYEGYTFVADTTAAAVTSPAMSVTTGDFILVACRGGTGTSVTATDSASNTFTALTAQSPSASQIYQLSWTIATATASITFTCTQSASAAGISLIAMHWSNTGSTVNTSAGTNSNTGVTPIVSPAITTSQRTLMIQCASEGALTSWTYGNMANGTGQVVGTSQSSVQATNADQGCQYRLLTAPLSSVTAAITPGATSGYATTVLAVNY